MEVYGITASDELGYIELDQSKFVGNAPHYARVKLTGEYTNTYKDITITDRCSRQTITVTTQDGFGYRFWVRRKDLANGDAPTVHKSKTNPLTDFVNTDLGCLIKWSIVRLDDTHLDRSLQGVASSMISTGTASASALYSGSYPASRGSDNNPNTYTLTKDGAG